jgi:ATP synthase delta (OSCP) subunit
MKVRLPDTISSPQDLGDLLLEVQEYARWFAHEAIKKRVNASHMSQTPAMSEGAAELIREQGGKKTLDQQAIDTIIATLKEYKESSPSLTITLAAPPTNSIKATLVGWCRENIAPNVLVVFKFNTNLLGGMIVRYGSRVFDWSFRRQLLANREKFPQVLRRV